MPRNRSPLQHAAGKLVSAIQKEWAEELGTDAAQNTEQVMYLAHDFVHVAAKVESIGILLGDRTVDLYLGRDWVRSHPAVWPFIRALEELAFDGDTSRDSEELP
jgi:hypothetical protein